MRAAGIRNYGSAHYRKCHNQQVPAAGLRSKVVATSPTAAGRIQSPKGGFMKTATMSGPELALIVGTRVALGIGIGLLLAGKLDRSARRGAGAALLVLGALS